MGEEGWLTKSEVNALYYNAVGGEIVFATEAQAGLHTKAVAKLITLHAQTRGKRAIRILEIGANNAAFARSLLGELRLLAAITAGSALDRIDYLAVEYARSSLEAAVRWELESDGKARLLRPSGMASATSSPQQATLVALVTTPGPPVTHLGLVHAEANQFVAASRDRFDVVILNELLDDLPGRVFYAGSDGGRHEVVAHARHEGRLWRVRISEHDLTDLLPPELAPGTLTARSPESVRLVQGASTVLESGGLLLVHDYGFAVPRASLATYDVVPETVPAFARLEFPRDSGPGFPKGFYRVYGNEARGVVQVTSDVNFAELAGALAHTGTVITLAHGNAIANHPHFTGFKRGDGVFLSEFGLLEPNDELPMLLDDLDHRQAGFRKRYVLEYLHGKEGVFHDLLYVKR